jgi:hypothetical protein
LPRCWNGNGNQRHQLPRHRGGIAMTNSGCVCPLRTLKSLRYLLVRSPRRMTSFHPQRKSVSGTKRHMIADNDLWRRNLARRTDRRSRYLYDGYEVQEAGLERRSTISHPRVGPHDLVSFGAASV